MWSATRRVFGASSFLVSRLTGEYVLDHHSASHWAPLYDVHRNAWIDDWAEPSRPGLPLPRLVWPQERVRDGEPGGRRRDRAAGGHPGRRRQHRLLVRGGRLRAARARRGPARLRHEHVPHRGPQPGARRTRGCGAPSASRRGRLNLAAGVASAGALTAWLRDLAGDVDYDTLYEEAAAAGPGAGGLLALPYFAGERTPLFDPDLRGAIVGLTAAHGRGHLFRALMEAAAFAVRQNLETMREAGATIAALRSSGGGAGGALWPRIVSDVTGLAQDVREGPSRAGVGAALLAAIGAGAATLADDLAAADDPRRARSGGGRCCTTSLYGWFRELAVAARPHAHALAVWQRDHSRDTMSPAADRDGDGARRRPEEGAVMTERRRRCREPGVVRRLAAVAAIVIVVAVHRGHGDRRPQPPARGARAARPAGGRRFLPCGTRSRESASRAASGSSSPSWRPSPSSPSRSRAVEASCSRWSSALALLGVAMLLARYALARDVRSLKQMETPGKPVPAARRGVLIMNLKSGGGKAEKFHLVDECRARGIEPVVLQRGDDLLQLARDAIDRGADVVGMAGGDGSQALVASVAAERGVPMVVIPAGTRNHFALDIGLDRDDVVGALDAYGEAREQTIDLADVNGRIFVNNVSLGLYATIVQSPEYRDAKRETALAALPEMLGPGSEPFDLRFTTPDGVAARGRARDPGVQRPLRHHRGRHHLASAPGHRAARRLLAGRARRRLRDARHRGADDRHAGPLRGLSLVGDARPSRSTSAAPIAVGLDGESLEMDPPLVFSSRPGVLRLRLPLQAIGYSPAARATGVKGLFGLWRVVLGRPVAHRRLTAASPRGSAPELSPAARRAVRGAAGPPVAGAVGIERVDPAVRRSVRVGVVRLDVSDRRLHLGEEVLAVQLAEQPVGLHACPAGGCAARRRRCGCPSR